MRFMMLVKADPDSEVGLMPSKELVAAMNDFNEAMAKAGVMLAGEGLHASSKGARVAFSGGARTVTRGPFPDPTSLVAGFWLIEVGSLEDAVGWASRIPFEAGEVEIRRVFDESDFPEEVLPPEEAARERALRDELARGARRGPC
jgi:hypothetical protein